MRKQSQYDPNQISQFLFDEETCSQRVSIVGMDNIQVNIDSDKIAQVLSDAIRNAQPNDTQAVSITQTPPVVYEPVFQVPAQQIVIQKEIEIVEVPLIVKETVIVEVEKQIIVERIKIEYVDKPVYVQKLVELQGKLPRWVSVVLGIQSVLIVVLMVIK